jgi:hypothetical protein
MHTFLCFRCYVFRQTRRQTGYYSKLLFRTYKVVEFIKPNTFQKLVPFPVQVNRIRIKRTLLGPSVKYSQATVETEIRVEPVF